MASIFHQMRDLERQGVYVGGWSVKHVLFPKRTADGKHGMNQYFQLRIMLSANRLTFR
jgi:hypothetical protein